MGACWSVSKSSRNLLQEIDGDEDDYHRRYLEDSVLGQGEFGVVKLVHDVSRPASSALACKILRKGVVFKDNVLLSAIKPHVLRGEVEILRELDGQCFCLKLIAIYESPRSLFMITEYCAGGEMMEFTTNLEHELRTEDVSRIAFQLLTAVDHCARHSVIHRDIKGENIMFLTSSPDAELRLIDFGSGCLDKRAPPNSNTQSSSERASANDGLIWHTTFAGSAFYISPEMFQRTYTDKTDCWSVGVTLYVLVAGYPADQLQKAFNILQTSTKRNLRELPNLPCDLPLSFYELLGALLTYRHKQRPSAGQLLQQEFVQFHARFERDPILSINEVAAAAHGEVAGEGDLAKSRSERTQSMALSGTQQKHSLFLGFKRFERSLTTLLATMLTKSELKRLLVLLHESIEQKHDERESENGLSVSADTKEQDERMPDLEGWQGQTLLVVQVKELRDIIQGNFANPQILARMEQLPLFTAYAHFAYHVALLSDFVEFGGRATNRLQDNKRNSSFANFRKGSNAGMLTDSVGSRGSVQSLASLNKGTATLNKSEKMLSRSLQGGNIFAKLAEGRKNIL